MTTAIGDFMDKEVEVTTEAEPFDWTAHTIMTMRREALVSASNRATQEANRCSELLRAAKLTPAGAIHLKTLMEALIKAATVLAKEAQR